MNYILILHQIYKGKLLKYQDLQVKVNDNERQSHHKLTEDNLPLLLGVYVYQQVGFNEPFQAFL